MVSKGTQVIKNYWKRRKELMLEGFENKCQICGYDRCNEALEFHHLNPSTKDMEISKQIKSWDKTLLELKKCICVCANCHREIHQGLINIDLTKQYFNEDLVKYYNPNHPKDESYYDTCPICGNKKLKSKKACCRTCYNKLPYKVDWSKYDIIDMIENKKMSLLSIGKLIGVSDNAVRKRYKKLKNNI